MNAETGFQDQPFGLVGAVGNAVGSAGISRSEIADVYRQCKDMAQGVLFAQGLRDPHEIEDILHDVLVGLLSGDYKLGNWKPYFYVTLCRKAALRRRKQGVWDRIREKIRPRPALSRGADPLVNAEEYELLMRGLASLGHEDQELLKLWANGVSAQEIAEILDLQGENPANAAYQRIHRAKKKLSDIVAGSGGRP